MIALLGNHPSIITWACHNEPMVFTRRANLEQRPDPALHRDAPSAESTRPVFICSGQMERRSAFGDVHSYYGALWNADYTNVCRYRFRLNTEFGFEAPAARRARAYGAWAGLDHLKARSSTVGLSGRVDPVPRRAFPPPARPPGRNLKIRSRPASPGGRMAAPVTFTSGCPMSRRRSARRARHPPPAERRLRGAA
jgi:hypothetical protein